MAIFTLAVKANGTKNINGNACEFERYTDSERMAATKANGDRAATIADAIFPTDEIIEHFAIHDEPANKEATLIYRTDGGDNSFGGYFLIYRT